MSQAAVVTDSCTSIPETLMERLCIHTVAYYIHRGQEVLRDLVTFQRDEFLRWLSNATELPTIASPRHWLSIPGQVRQVCAFIGQKDKT